MGSAAVLGVLIIFLCVILAGLLSGLDRDAIRATPSGSLSTRGLLGIVGGGFVVGLAYGTFIGFESGAATWQWIGRGIIDGLVVACAGAFYLGFQQRRNRADRTKSAVVEGSDPDPAPDDPTRGGPTRGGPPRE